jgi:uncharacterized protein YndB with AHSA1/START domain
MNMTTDLNTDLTKLQLVLDGDTDIIIRRDFTHPPARVWRALTEPDLIMRWIDGTTRCEMDPRPGGSFRYEWDAFYFWGHFLTVDAPHRMTQVQHFSRDPSYRVEFSVDVIARGSGTRMTQVMRYADAGARAAAIADGFTDGMDELYARLEALQFSQ